MNRLKLITKQFGILAFALLIIASQAFALDINKTVLENGLTVLHVERHNLPLVMVTLLVKSGSVDEPAEKAGLANLAASLLTEGTKKRTSQDISQEAEFIGAELGASAGADYCTVGLAVLKKDIDKGFELFGDVLLNPVFPKSEIKRRKELIKGSLRQKEDQPSYIASRAFKREVFGVHPYGWLLTGTPETIDKISRKDIGEFYDAYFLPNNSILSVVGDIGEEELDGLIRKWLKGWGKRPLQRRVLPDIGHPKKKVVLIDKDISQANILLGHPGVRRANPDHYALSIMNYILGGGGFSSRLMDSIRDEMGLAYDVHSRFSTSMHGGLFSVGVQTKNASARTVIGEVIGHIERIKKEGVTDRELEDAKAFLVGSFPRRIDTMKKIANFLAVVEFYGLGLDYPEKYPGIMKSITAEDVLRVAMKHLNTDDYVLVVVANHKETGLKEKETDRKQTEKE
jgi:zinc protease